MNACFTRSWITRAADRSPRADPARQPARAALLALSICLLAALPAFGAESVPGRARPSGAFGLRGEGPAVVVAVAAAPPAGLWGSIFSPLQSALGNRKRMLQIGVIGMCIALYIIMWRR